MEYSKPYSNMSKTAANWSLYIIEASDASLYTGITTDVERRFAEHTQGPRGARYFNGRSPLRIIYREDGHDRSSASRREAQIKKLSRKAKCRLIAQAEPNLACEPGQ
jgi:putative endonuclease